MVIALNIAKDATAAFPPLQSAAGGVAGIVDVVKVSEPFEAAARFSSVSLQKIGANIDQIKLLEQYANQLSTTLQNPVFKHKKTCREDVRWRIDILERQDYHITCFVFSAYSLVRRQLKETTKEIRKLASRSKLSRFFRSDSHAGTIDEHITKISQAIEIFLVSLACKSRGAALLTTTAYRLGGL